MALRICRICGLEAKTEEDLNQFEFQSTSKFEHSNLCLKCRRDYSHNYNVVYYNNHRKKQTSLLRKQIIDKLSGVCVICGFSDPHALQIDHINDDGYKERQHMRDGISYYTRLLEKPDEELYANYQCLCANCNNIKKYESTTLNGSIQLSVLGE